MTDVIGNYDKKATATTALITVKKAETCIEAAPLDEPPVAVGLPDDVREAVLPEEPLLVAVPNDPEGAEVAAVVAAAAVGVGRAVNNA